MVNSHTANRLDDPTDDEHYAAQTGPQDGLASSLWVAGFVSLIAVAGAALLPKIIQLAGRGGQRETVEWLVYLVLGTAFPAAVASIAWLGPRLLGMRRMQGLQLAFATALVAASGLLFANLGLRAALISVMLAVATVGGMTAFGPAVRTPWGPRTIGLLAVVSAAWASALTLASWTTVWGWASNSVMSIPLLLLFIGVTVVSLFGWRTPNAAQHRKISSVPVSISSGSGTFDGSDGVLNPVADDVTSPRGAAFRLTKHDVPAIVAFLILSFRTTPIVEFYHWSFWVGPIESVRQGGWLLWDVPSQYGFLSVLLPALLPVSDGWQALYLFQGILYIAVATALYAILKALRPGIPARFMAFVFTSAALFFRPRTDVLILPAQMTPAGGPMRFIGCYAILAVLIWKYWRGDRVSPKRFAIVGTLVWVTSVAWSAESAIYCTVAWVGALGVFALQRAFAESREPAKSEFGSALASDMSPGADRAAFASRRRWFSLRPIIGGLAVLALGLSSAVAIVSAYFQIREGHGPDWSSYYEYALLFSGGYSALPIDGYGAVWYLIVLFAAASTAVVHFLMLDPRHPRVFVAAGAWGTIWAISSYFVSRSHPVNLLSLIPLLVFSLVVILHLARSVPAANWVLLLRLVAVPLICVPPALTLSHRGFMDLLREPQTPMASLSVQVPAMDSSLAALALQAGMSPADPVFFTSDGRYLMPRWPVADQTGDLTNERAWMPKPYEMISTLPPERRDAYMERFAARIGSGGWLIQKKSEVNPGYESVVRVIERRFAPVETFENDVWLVRRYVSLPAS